MAQNKTAFGHNGLDQHADTINKAMGIKYMAWAENVAWNSGKPNPAASAVAQWITSPGHKKNLEGNYTMFINKSGTQSA